MGLLDTFNDVLNTKVGSACYLILLVQSLIFLYYKYMDDNQKQQF